MSIFGRNGYNTDLALFLNLPHRIVLTEIFLCQTVLFGTLGYDIPVVLVSLH